MHLFSEAVNQNKFPIGFHLKLFRQVILKVSELSLESASQCPRINTIPLPPIVSSLPPPTLTQPRYVQLRPLTSQLTLAPTVAKPGRLSHVPDSST